MFILSVNFWKFNALAWAEQDGQDGRVAWDVWTNPLPKQAERFNPNCPSLQAYLKQAEWHETFVPLPQQWHSGAHKFTGTSISHTLAVSCPNRQTWTYASQFLTIHFPYVRHYMLWTTQSWHAILITMLGTILTLFILHHFCQLLFPNISNKITRTHLSKSRVPEFGTSH